MNIGQIHPAGSGHLGAKMKYSTLVSGLIFITVSANANIVINGTRFIYPEKNKEIVVQLNNSGDAPSLVLSLIHI